MIEFLCSSDYDQTLKGHANMLACLKRKLASEATRPDNAIKVDQVRCAFRSGFVVFLCSCLDRSIVSFSCLLEFWWFYNICLFYAKFRKTYRQNSGIQRGETLLRIIEKTMNAHQDNTYTWREDWEGVWRVKGVIHVKLEQSALSRGGGSWHQLSDTCNGVLWTAWAPFAPDGDLGQRHSRSLLR